MLQGLRSSLRLSLNYRRGADGAAKAPPRCAPVAARGVAVLGGDTSYLRRVVALSDGAHVVAAGDLNQLLVFAANGDRLAELPHPAGHRAHYDDFVRGLADLGGGIFVSANVCSGGGSVLRTWCAPDCAPVATVAVPRERVFALRSVGDGVFAAAVGGDLVFYEHRRGADVRPLPRLRASWIHTEVVYDLDACGDRVVTASNDHTAVVWDWRACAPVVVLRTGQPVLCCAMNESTVVLGSRVTVRVYDSGMKFGCVHFIDYAHDNSVTSCGLWGGNIVTVSLDGTIVVTDRASGVTVSRLALKLPGYDFDMFHAADCDDETTKQGELSPRIVVVGLGDGVMFQSPRALLKGSG